jgi:hypothetical protein
MTREPSPVTARARCQTVMRSKWFMPLLCLGLGAGMFVASWLGGHPGAGAVSLGLMAGFGLVLLLVARRSETIRGLTFGRDERFAQIDLRATAVAGLAVIVALIAAWLAAVAHGQSGNPYGWLLAIAGLAYIAAVAFFRWRG